MPTSQRRCRRFARSSALRRSAPVRALGARGRTRPLAAGLVYPVNTMEAQGTHEMSRKRLLGETPSAARVAQRSAERQVTDRTPPAFLIPALDDAAVPVENRLRLPTAMREIKRPVEAHFVQEGGPAFGTGRPGTPSENRIALFSSRLGRIHS